MNLTFVDVLGNLLSGCCLFNCHNVCLLLLGSAYSTLGTLASTSVLLGALTSNGQTFTMSYSAVAADFGKTLDVKSDFTMQITLGLNIVLYITSDCVNLIFGKIFNSDIRINSGCL